LKAGFYQQSASNGKTMAKNYQVGLVIKGNAKGGVTAIKATKDELAKLNSKQKRFQYETKKSNNSIGQMASKFGLLKASVIGAVASIASIASGKQFIDDFTQQEQAISLLDASIASMGRTTIGLSSQLQKLASQIQKEGIIGDEVLIKGQSFLTTYKDITDELLPRTTRVMADLSAKMGGDSVRAANLLGKASMGLTGALSIAGISLSDATKKSKDFESILGEIEDQVGGTNKALGSASTGGFTQFSNALGDLRENLGEILTIALGDHFRGWSLEIGITKENIQSFGSSLKVLVASLATIAKIVMVGGALVLGFKGITIAVTIAAAAKRFLAMNVLATSMAYTAGVGPLALFSASLQASTAATWSAITAFGVLKTAALSLFAAFAGWEIGSLLREQFVEVRVAGLAFVGAMETGLVNLTYAFSAVAPKVKQVWGELTTWLKNKLGALYGLIGDGLSKVGADDMAQGYKNFAESLAGSSDAAKTATAELKVLEEQRQADIEAVDRIIVSLINHEYAQETNTAAINKNTEAKANNKGVKSGATPEELTSNQKLIVSLGEQVHMLNLTANKKLLHANLSKLSKDATIGEIAAVTALTEAQYEQQKKGDLTKHEDDFYKNAIDGVNGYAEAWASAGNVIVDTFGSIGQQMEKLFTSQGAYTKAIEINHKKQQAVGADIGKLKKEEYALNRANAQSEINSYGSIAGAAASMFNKKSKAAKTFHAIEQVMAVASLAMSVQKMVMSTTETGVHVANETTKQSSNALTAITSAFTAPFPVGFVAGAAMIGIMASLIGGSFGSSGSAPPTSAERQKTQGTGTVLGSDEKSQSILNAYERIEALELDQYAELRQMNDSLYDLNNNITHLATSLVSNFGRFNGESYSGELGSKSTTSKIEELLIGGVIGQFAKAIDPTGIVGKIFSGFSSKKKSLVDSGISIVSQTMGDIFESGIVQAQSYYDIKTKKKKYWGASSKTSYNTEFEDVDGQLQHELALVFSNIGDSINSAVDVLGLDITKNLDNFVIDLPNISLKDLSGDEVKAELEAIFSSQSDLMATYLVPGIVTFQQVGEGLYDTLIRVAQEQAIFNSAMGNIGKTLADVSTEIKIGITQNLVELMGGIENFSESTNAYFAAFFSDEEKFNILQKQLISQFKSSSAVLPETRKEFRALVDALDLTTQSGQKAYASLVKLSPQLDEYYAQMEGLESDRQELFAGILSSLGDSLSSTIGEYLNLLNSEVNAQIRTEQQRINEVNRGSKNAYKEQLSAVNALHSASQTLNTLMQSLLLNDLSTLNPLAKFDEAQSQFDALFTRAENGDVDAANSLGGAASTLLTLGKELFASSATYKDLFVDVNNQLSTVADITGAALAPTESDELTSSALLEQLNDSLIVEEAVDQSELLRNILTQLQSVAFATGEDVTTLAESMGLDLEQLPEGIRAQIETIGLALDATMADITFADSIDTLGDTLAANFASSIAGIDTTVDFTSLIRAVHDANDSSSLRRALTHLETAVGTVGGDVRNSLAPWFGNSALANDIKNKLNQLGLAEAAKQDAYISSLAGLELNLDIEIPINGVLNPNLDIDIPDIGIGSGDVLSSYDKGTPYVPHDQIAQIHQGEIIMDPQSSAALRKYGINVSGSGGDNTAVVAEIKNLNNNIERLIIATEKVEQAADSKEVVRELKNNRLTTKTRKFG
jgi:hypothetical protein